MSITFNLRYNAMNAELIVEQDGKPVSKYSQFSHCANTPFWNWYKNIAGYCFSEANGMYDVHFEGGLIQSLILKNELNAGKGCSHFVFRPKIITGEDRMYLLEELISYCQVGVPTYKIELSIKDRQGGYVAQLMKLVDNATTLQYLHLKKMPLYLNFRNHVDNSTQIAIVHSKEEFYRIANMHNSTVPMMLIIIQPDMQFIEAVNGCFLFACKNDDISQIVSAWISDIVFPGYAKPIIERMRHCQNWYTIDQHTAMQKIDLLYRDTPYLALSVTQSIELSSVGKFSLDKFPKDMPCKVYSSNANVALLGGGGVIKPTGEGDAEIVAESKVFPEYRTFRSISVFKYQKVQKIILNASKTNLIVGEQFTVTCDFKPRNAHNISMGRWEIIPSDGMKMISGRSGVFQAIKPGNCEIVYKVGNVQEHLRIVVSANPSSVAFADKSIAVKLGDNSQRVIATIHPIGSKGGSIKYKVSNTSVIDFDSNNGQISPKREGTSVITAILLDNKGSIIDDCNCNITVLPPKDIVTPDGALVLLIISLIGTFLLINTEFSILCGISGFIGAMWYSIKERTTKSYILSALLMGIIILCICVGGAI